MDDGRVRYHETNEGRETSQGFAGFEGNNVLLLLGAVGLSLVLSQGVDNLGLALWANILIMVMPILVVSAYVFGLKQGKPKSYDIELAEWLIIKLTGTNYFSPRQVQPLKLPWTENVKKPLSPSPPPPDVKNR
ncbi:MAG: hypothetical protein JWO94_2802 [Verrucomicrobiaceae bacterium]|nr:hypothetical protein [Verrucomicrobiaceae bacterium]